MKILLPIHKRSTLFYQINEENGLGHEITISPIRKWKNLDQYDLVVPLSLNQIRVAKKLNLTKNTVLPNDRAMNLCDHKLALNSFLIQSGLGEHIPELFPSEFPMIKKPNIGIASEGIEIYQEERKIDYEKLLKRGEFLQQYIYGNEYSINAVILNNKVIYIGNYNYDLSKYEMLHHQEYEDRKKKIEKGVNRLEKTSQNTIEFIEKVCSVLDYGSGVFHMGYKEVDGVIKLIEINPRWSATSIFYMEELVCALKKSLNDL